jgi:hypothetical protein
VAVAVAVGWVGFGLVGPGWVGLGRCMWGRVGSGQVQSSVD